MYIKMTAQTDLDLMRRLFCCFKINELLSDSAIPG